MSMYGKDKTEGFYKMIEKAFTDGYIDDHTGKSKHPEFLVILCKPGHHYGDVNICPAEKTNFCLNPLYEEADGTIHLSKCQIGSGIMFGIECEYDAQLQMKQYNFEHMFDPENICRKTNFEFASIISKERWEAAKKFDEDLKNYSKKLA